jgi:phytoene dehydrogenase-like protein
VIQNQDDHPERTVALPNRADIILIGAGHNALTCAAYLARAGRDVLVLEARDEPGGCASTVDAIGARVNICNCDHTMVLASGIIEDLNLAAHGLRYLDVDPMQIAVAWPTAQDAQAGQADQAYDSTTHGSAAHGGSPVFV